MKRSCLVAATTNPHKLREIRRILQGSGIQVKPLSALPPLPEVLENGRTLQANAAKKALAVTRATGWPALADDSGLFVPALAGRPGVRSARFAGPECDYQRNNQKLLRAMRNFTGRKRRAYFATVMAWSRPGRPVQCQMGKIWGRITLEPAGRQGFGYDPVFQPSGQAKTFAQMTAGEKNQISHRGLALRKIAAKILHDAQH